VLLPPHFVLKAYAETQIASLTRIAREKNNPTATMDCVRSARTVTTAQLLAGEIGTVRSIKNTVKQENARGKSV